MLSEIHFGIVLLPNNYKFAFAFFFLQNLSQIWAAFLDISFLPGVNAVFLLNFKPLIQAWEAKLQLFNEVEFFQLNSSLGTVFKVYYEQPSVFFNFFKIGFNHKFFIILLVLNCIYLHMNAHTYICSNVTFQFWRKLNLNTSALFCSLYILKGSTHSSACSEVTDIYCYRCEPSSNEHEGKHCLHCQYCVETDCILIWCLPHACLLKNTK